MSEQRAWDDESRSERGPSEQRAWDDESRSERGPSGPARSAKSGEA